MVPTKEELKHRVAVLEDELESLYDHLDHIGELLGIETEEDTGNDEEVSDDED